MYSLRIIFPFSIVWIISSVFAVPNDLYTIPDINVLIVSQGEPTDGHLRFYRSSEFAQLNPKLCSLNGPKSNQLTEVLNALRKFPSNRNAFTIVTPSDQLIVTKQKTMLAFYIANVLLTKNRQIIIPNQYKMTDHNTEWDDAIQEIVTKNQAKFAHLEFSPRPSTWKEWLTLSAEFAKYKSLKVRQSLRIKELQQTSPHEEQFCAFAGIHSSVLKFMEILISDSDVADNSTLFGICRLLSINNTLQMDLNVYVDRNHDVFKMVEPIYDRKPGISAEIDDSLVYTAEGYDFAPISFGPLEEIPFDLLNLAAGDVASDRRCETCPDKPFKFDVRYKNRKEYPTVAIFIPRYSPHSNLHEFVKRILALSYPKDRIHLHFIFNSKENKKYEDYLNKEENLKKYKSLSIYSTTKLTAIEIFDRCWKKFQQTPDIQYAFVLDPQVQITNKNIIQLLMEKNRRIIGPYLNQSNGESNFFENRYKIQLYNNHFHQTYTTGHTEGEMSFNGTFQVPYVFGALLMQKSVADKMQNPFAACSYTCNPSDVNCTALEDKQRQACDQSYYIGLSQTEHILWGMMMKLMLRQGSIPYMNNEHVFGYIQK